SAKVLVATVSTASSRSICPPAGRCRGLRCGRSADVEDLRGSYVTVTNASRTWYVARRPGLPARRRARWCAGGRSQGRARHTVSSLPEPARRLGVTDYREPFGRLWRRRTPTTSTPPVAVWTYCTGVGAFGSHPGVRLWAASQMCFLPHSVFCAR